MWRYIEADVSSVSVISMFIFLSRFVKITVDVLGFVKVCVSLLSSNSFAFFITLSGCSVAKAWERESLFFGFGQIIALWFSSDHFHVSWGVAVL